MKHWEKAYEHYMLDDYETDEEERDALLDAAARYAKMEMENPEFFEHPLFRKIVGGMYLRHDEELKEAFQAGWEAHQRHLLKGIAQKKRKIK